MVKDNSLSFTTDTMGVFALLDNLKKMRLSDAVESVAPKFDGNQTVKIIRCIYHGYGIGLINLGYDGTTYSVIDGSKRLSLLRDLYSRKTFDDLYYTPKHDAFTFGRFYANDYSVPVNDIVNTFSLLGTLDALKADENISDEDKQEFSLMLQRVNSMFHGLSVVVNIYNTTFCSKTVLENVKRWSEDIWGI